MQRQDSTYGRIGVAADPDFREVVAELEELSHVGGEFEGFEQSGDLSYNTINELLQRNGSTYPCTDPILAS
jgi:hypothetical protein